MWRPVSCRGAYAEADPERAVGEEVDQLEVELAEAAVRLREVPVVREQLPHLHRVLDHVQELEDHEQAEAGEECVSGAFVLRLGDVNRNPWSEEGQRGELEAGPQPEGQRDSGQRDCGGERHCFAGRVYANAAWTVLAAIAHNLLPWTELLGLPDGPIRAARTVRRRLLQLPGRLVSHAGRFTLRLPARWPWQTEFIEALTRIRALPAAA